MATSCWCADWALNIDKVNAPNQLLFARNPGTYKGYEGAQFRFCPWCGEKLRPRTTGDALAADDAAEKP